MGCCFSTGTTTTDAVHLPPTVKVITVSGALREYSTPVAASDVLGSDSAGYFLCNSDRLYCDEYIPALDPEELLQRGQIYFVLPSTKLRFPLSGGDMAALAVKASAALELSSGRDGRGNKKIRIMPVLDLEDNWAGSASADGPEKGVDEKVRPGASPVVVQRKMNRSGSIRARVAYRYSSRYSRAKLGTIPELVE